MCEISVVMPVYNSEKYVNESIESVLMQSFDDFELIIVDDGSSDKTYSIVRSYTDKRIKLIKNNHDFIKSLNIGVNSAKGKYLARMDADDIMHVDRLKIQHAIMQEYANVTVCGTWMNTFGQDFFKNKIVGDLSGLVEKPILKLLKGSFLFHPTAMIRASFLKENLLMYENYRYAEDYKLWTEIAKLNGQFYIENQPLLDYRISENQVSKKYGDQQKESTELIITEIIKYLIQQNTLVYPELSDIYVNFCNLQEKQLITKYEISVFFQNLFSKHEQQLML